MSLLNSFDNETKQYLELMCRLYLITKKYLLIAEEIAENGEIFLQPLKEHRDAYDHLIRCYNAELSPNTLTEEERNSYELENIKKAFGHGYRAFFDTADWLTYQLRRWIRIHLKELGEPKCESIFENYSEIKKYINELPQQVALLRESKDVGKHDRKSDGQDALIEEIDAYREVMDKLIELKRTIAPYVTV